MPYDDIAQLPELIRQTLPLHAQALYREAFNGAWRQYVAPYQHKGENDRVTTAHRAAWGAVEEQYRRDDDGVWRQK